MSFEKFVKTIGRNSSKVPQVTISRTGMLLLNKAAAQDCFADVCRVSLWFDSENRRAGIRPEPDDATNELVLCKQRDHRSRSIAGWSFMRNYDIDCTPTRRATLTREGDMWVFDADAKEAE